MKTTLGLKVSRRLIAVVAVTAGEIVFHDQRHLPLQANHLEASTTRYLTELLKQFTPIDVAYHAPTTSGSLAWKVIDILERLAAGRNILITRLNRADLYAGISSPPPGTRRGFHDQVQRMWPQLTRDANTNTLRRELPAAEAAATAMLSHLWSQLPPP